MGISIRVFSVILSTFLWASIAAAQAVTVVRNVNLRPEQSSSEKEIRLLTPSEPPLELMEPYEMDGYYHVRTIAGEEGYVWSRFVHVSVAPAPGAPGPLGAAAAISLGPGVPGSASMQGCGDSRWAHVYNPTRLLVKNDCVTVTGVIMDATASQSRHRKDGMRHEKDGDTHGWLKVDSQFDSLLNEGNHSPEADGNLIFEFVCRYPVSQGDAKAACAGFTDGTALPKVGAHVAIRGTFVQEKNHKHWHEIHPVTSIKVQ